MESKVVNTIEEKVESAGATAVAKTVVCLDASCQRKGRWERSWKDGGRYI